MAFIGLPASSIGGASTFLPALMQTPGLGSAGSDAATPFNPFAFGDFNFGNLGWMEQLNSMLGGMLGINPGATFQNAAAMPGQNFLDGVGGAQKSFNSGNSTPSFSSGNSNPAVSAGNFSAPAYSGANNTNATRSGNYNAPANNTGLNPTANNVTASNPTQPGQTAGISNKYDSYFAEAAQKTGLSANLLKAQAQQESRMNPNDVSPAGAMGVMQVMPGTAKDLGLTNPFDAKESIMKGASYLKDQIDKFDGNVALGLAAYNAGAGNVKNGKIPQNGETPEYVEKVLAYKEELDKATAAKAKEEETAKAAEAAKADPTVDAATKADLSKQAVAAAADATETATKADQAKSAASSAESTTASNDSKTATTASKDSSTATKSSTGTSDTNKSDTGSSGATKSSTGSSDSNKSSTSSGGSSTSSKSSSGSGGSTSSSSSSSGSSGSSSSGSSGSSGGGSSSGGGPR
jgi:hypothetical protein